MRAPNPRLAASIQIRLSQSNILNAHLVRQQYPFDVSKMILLQIIAIKSVGVGIAALHSRSRHLICRRQYLLNT